MNRFCLIIALLCGLFLFGCHSNGSDNKVIRVGTIAGPETELMEVAKKVAKQKNDLNIKIIQFNDYVMPNQALAEGSIDANMFQHLPYLQETIANKKYQLAPIGKTFIYPMGIYSSKIKRLSDLKDNSIVGIPNDPSNQARALLLLEKAGLIKLKSNNINVTVHSIIQNHKNLKFKELDAAQLPRVLPDVDIAAINTNYAMIANLMPSRDALFLENANSPYANIVVVQEKDKDDPKFQQFMDALHSPEVMAKAKELFQGQALPAWQNSKS